MRRRRGNELEVLPRPFRPLVFLWLARMLVNLGGIKHVFEGDRLTGAELLTPFRLKGLKEEEKANPPQIRANLKARLAELEAAKPSLPPRATLTRNLQHLGDLMGLDSTERAILAFLLVGQQSTSMECLLDRFGNMTGTRLHYLVSGALGHPMVRVRKALAPSGRLATSGLVRLDLGNKWDFTNKVELMPGLFERLCISQKKPYGIFASSFVLAPAARLSTKDYSHLVEDIAILKPYLREALRLRRMGVNILLHGHPGSGKTQFVRMLAGVLGCELFEVATETEEKEAIQGEQRFRSYRLAQTILHNAGSTLVLFDEVEDVFQQITTDSEHPLQNNRSGIKAWVNRTLEENPIPAFWVTNQLGVLDPAFLRRFDYVLEVDVPPRSVRARVLRSYLGDLPVDPAWTSTMAEHQNLMPALVERSADVVRLALDADPDLNVSKALPRALGNTLEALGADREARGVQSIVTRYRPEILNTDCDLGSLIPGLRRSSSGRLCFYGPPGTGKTAFGLHLAKELDLPFLVQRASDLLGMFVGESEKNIARMFAAARQDGALLLLDEAESFLQDRKGAQRSWEITQVNEMLTQMESFPGIFITSTNLMDTLDPASLRRFDVKIRFDFLRREQALLMLEDLAESLGLAVDPTARKAMHALTNLTPGDFAAVARQTRFRPASSAMDLVGRLEAECELKPEGKRKPIGFSSPTPRAS